MAGLNLRQFNQPFVDMLCTLFPDIPVLFPAISRPIPLTILPCLKFISIERLLTHHLIPHEAISFFPVQITMECQPLTFPAAILGFDWAGVVLGEMSGFHAAAY